MRWQADGVKKVTRRAFILGGVELSFAFVLFSRMFYLQVIEADKYKMLAERNRVTIKLLPPPRGLIFDRNGVPLAYNRKSFRAVVTAEETGGHLRRTLRNTSTLVPISNEEVERILKETRRKKSFTPVRIKDDLSFEEMASLQLNYPELAGLSIEDSLMRMYPEKESLAHPLGYLSFITEDDLARDPSLSKMPDVRIGRTGIEEFYQSKLYGTAGTQKVETNAVGREVRELGRTGEMPGESMTLSLDSRLQKTGYEALKNESGSAILMDIDTGAVRMMVSTPSFDPNIFNYPVDAKTWNELNQSERHPLLNKAIQGEYSPGSTFKIVVALAALEARVINENTTVTCTGKMFVGSHPFHCWRKEGHGPVNLVKALQRSCDIFFYETARQVGVDRIVDMAERLGLGMRTGVDLKGERAGFVPTRMWKENRYGDAWRLGDTMNLGIGQGFLLTTPLQMAVMMARVANMGKKVSPSIYQSPNQLLQNAESLGIAPAHLKLVMKGLEAVVNEKTGTAYHTRFNVGGERMGGKTASTQIRRISLKEREEGLKQQRELAWCDRDHAFFVAYAPVDNPKYALAVAIEHGGGGGAAAAPVASKIMRHALELDQEERIKK